MFLFPVLFWNCTLMYLVLLFTSYCVFSLPVFFSSLTHFTHFLIPSLYHCVCVQLLLSPLSSSVSSMLFRCGLSSALLCVSTWWHPAFLTSIFSSVSLHLFLSHIDVFFFLFIFFIFVPWIFINVYFCCYFVLGPCDSFLFFSSSIGFVFQRCFIKARLLFPISLLPYVCFTICRHLGHFVGCFKC